MGRKAKLTGLFFLPCLALLVLVAWRAGASKASKVDKCLECHRATWDEAESMRYIHLPFQQKKCLHCHESRKARRQRQMEEKRRVESQVTWLGRNPGLARVQWLTFKADPYGATVLVEAKGPGVGVHRQRVKVPPVDGLDPVPAADSPPRISNVRVVEVERGIFLSARIAWDTDQPATSLVRYGIGALNQSSGLDPGFDTHHEVVLTGIRSNRTYRFRVESESMGGRKAVSGEKEFSTARAFRLDRQEEAGGDDGGDGDLSLACKLFRGKGDQYVIRVEASRPVAVSVGLVPDERGDSYGSSGSGSEVVRHIITSSDLFANITVCYTCHREYQKILSHPVNVYPKPGMVIPPDYPTMDDGRISCNSCHANHASGIRFRLIRPGKKELCIGCHKDMA